MDTLKTFLVGIIGIAMFTTAVLPNRQTVGVINAMTGLFRGTLATAMGTGRQV